MSNFPTVVMSNFPIVVRHTLEREGVFSDHAADPGGRTKYGITERLAITHGVDSIRTLTVDEAKWIYKQEFWVPLQLDRIDSIKVAAEIFDTAVNIGMIPAVEIVQKALNTIFLLNQKPLVVDGRLGRHTRQAINATTVLYEPHLVAALNGFQFNHYLRLYRRRPEQFGHFIKGWMMRVVPIDPQPYLPFP